MLLRGAERFQLCPTKNGIQHEDLAVVVELADQMLDGCRGAPSELHQGCPMCGAVLAVGQGPERRGVDRSTGSCRRPSLSTDPTSAVGDFRTKIKGGRYAPAAPGPPARPSRGGRAAAGALQHRRPTSHSPEDHDGGAERFGGQPASGPALSAGDPSYGRRVRPRGPLTGVALRCNAAELAVGRGCRGSTVACRVRRSRRRCGSGSRGGSIRQAG